MPTTLRTLLMFQGGVAEEAMTFYTSLFPESGVDSIDRFQEGEAAAGKVKLAVFRVAGQELLCFDSPIAHAFDFTPSMSLYVECESEAQQQKAFDALSAGGTVLMALDAYGFSKRFGWVNDRFGVSWQLNVG